MDWALRVLVSAGVVVLLGGAVACTTSADGPPSAGEGPFFTRSGGTYDKISIVAKDGTGVLEAGRFRAFVSDANNLCSTGALRQGATTFGLDTNGTTLGTFAATFQVSKNDTSCNGAGATDATNAGSGTVTITRVDATVVEGTFDATLSGDAGSLTGSFNVPLCPALNVTSCVP